jgi:hypothetical protein
VPALVHVQADACHAHEASQREVTASKCVRSGSLQIARGKRQ